MFSTFTDLAIANTGNSILTPVVFGENTVKFFVFEKQLPVTNCECEIKHHCEK